MSERADKAVQDVINLVHRLRRECDSLERENVDLRKKLEASLARQRGRLSASYLEHEHIGEFPVSEDLTSVLLNMLDAIDRGGLDVFPCKECGGMVITAKNAYPICVNCLKKGGDA